MFCAGMKFLRISGITSRSTSVVNIAVANANLDVVSGGILTATTINLTAGALRVVAGGEIVG